MVTAVVVLLVFELIFELVAHEGAGEGSHYAMATHLVSAEVARGSSAERAHQASIALGLVVWICGTIALLAGLAGLTIWILALGILILWISALLRELLCWRRARVLLLLIVLARMRMSAIVSKPKSFGTHCNVLTLAVGMDHRTAQDSGRAGIRLVLEGRSLAAGIAAVARRSTLGFGLAEVPAADSPAEVGDSPDQAQANRTGSGDTAGIADYTGCMGLTWWRWSWCGCTRTTVRG